jgi:serine/threonine protein kinase
MWSVGVVTYILLGGYAPFEGPVHELARVITRGDYCFHDKYWSDISEEAKDLISNLLQVDPEKRYSAVDALGCPWMISDEEGLAIKDLSLNQQALKEKKAATEVVPTKVTKKKEESLDVSFTNALGTAEEVENRKAQRTNKKKSVSASVEEDDEDEDQTVMPTFDNLYKWGKKIGEGNFSIIHECKNKKTKEVFVTKRVQRAALSEMDAVGLLDEIVTLKIVSTCPYIVTLHEAFDEPDYTYMIMERLRGGELISRIIDKGCYPEDEARLVVQRVLLGLEHCHKRRIANRNIKLENLILTTPDSDIDVKITDFGFAKRVLYPNSLQTQVCKNQLARGSSAEGATLGAPFANLTVFFAS